MSIIKKKDLSNQPVKAELDELVDADGGMISGDRNVVSNSEIETGPVQKPFNDTSDFEKGVSTTTDRAARYRQNIPWFANYSARGASRGIREVFTKKHMEEKIEDLVKKNKYDGEFTDKNFDKTVTKLIDMIQDNDLSDDQITAIKDAISQKKAKTQNTL